MGTTPAQVTVDDIREAARGIVGVAARTPLQHVPQLSEAAGVPVYLKLENQQPTGAFKLRGAWTFVRQLDPESRRRGVITYSSGNHGQAVAFAAQRVGARAVVVMPETAPATKIEGVKRWDGEVVFAGRTSEDRYRKALAMAEAEGLTIIPPYDHPAIIAGQGTTGLEIAEELPEIAHVAVPVGGGGLIAGITTALRAIRPEARVTGVEPEGAAALHAALAAGHPVRLERTASMADGLLPLAVGTLTFAHVRDVVDAVRVPEEAIAEATVWLHREVGVTAEPSGAVTTAALRTGALVPHGPTVLVVSGGNVDLAMVNSLQGLS
ncbi:MAG: threonine/serine dehydratase [Gemmatimonadota bacterium]|nr:threonine/serine dehydratase [Gemmatimonadota bacterium]MDH3367859.1 threonine/serine dehydratase [Gemmatimonadota bacterium]MDH3477552.1 threonine/serine dehydratase [Gemmatimonadota bacterium]MDH3569158.1 threonine/serine dehydratase [Gemmatimonadota bacterium]MDH5551227.1 threonine/serine dehydratase [Gemmatimonadota bacterium]